MLPSSDRDVLEEHEITREQGSGLLVEHREIAVAMRGRPRPQDKDCGTEIELERRRRPSSVGGTMRTSSISSSPMIRLNASR